ncbi:hypothetical protein D0C36_02930 [Mucilaginibacter conchicola]|uniref:Carboxypeptidase-like regulatory domain-containing protein n=1 Tax=Mucilaginibacter conchicola TaxID=2303333 RepID=A0A372NWM3_9SPHI|nr:carboxypeptidase-like regulatory domain-containing protein [Mucilaginibacter conchicola]RFZ94516.1 hypothetical protein D0C36_02930 [Mucilaginibacter conchicola]
MLKRNKILTLLPFLLSLFCRVSGQIRTISGLVIDDHLTPVPGVQLRLNDTTLIGTTNSDGRFNTDIPQNTNTLHFGFVGFEPATIRINDNCDTIEIILLPASTYDFMSPKKIDRLRLKQFKTLPGLYLEA